MLALAIPNGNGNLLYKTNSTKKWEPYSSDTKIILNAVGDWVKFGNTTNKFTPIWATDLLGDYGYIPENDGAFKLSGKIAASGSVQSLVNDCATWDDDTNDWKKDENGNIIHNNLIAGKFSGLFGGCSGLIIAPELPATKLTDNCYEYMFNNCPNLVNAPELPATNLAPACYELMFTHCTSLTSAPELPATSAETAVYNAMFTRCTSLKKAPLINLNTGINSHYWPMYNMFAECENLNSIEVRFTDWNDRNF